MIDHIKTLVFLLADKTTVIADNLGLKLITINFSDSRLVCINK